MQNTENKIPHMDRSYSEIFGDIGGTAKDIIQSDISLIFTELNKIKINFAKESKKFVTYGILLALSTIPLLMSAIIGLGIALDGRYWLSSLIIGVTLAVAGAIGISIALKKIKRIDMDFSKTKAAIKKEGQAIYSQVSKIQDAVRGERHA